MIMEWVKTSIKEWVKDILTVLIWFAVGLTIILTIPYYGMIIVFTALMVFIVKTYSDNIKLNRDIRMGKYPTGTFISEKDGSFTYTNHEDGSIIHGKMK